MRHLIFSAILLTSPLAFSQEVPGNFTYQGRIFKTNGVDPVEDSLSYSGFKFAHLMGLVFFMKRLTLAT